MAVVYLTCVLEDGVTPRHPLVPSNVRTTLEVTQGTTTQVVVRVLNPGGAPVGDGTLQLTVARGPYEQPLAALAGTWAAWLGIGVAIFSVVPSTFAGVEWGRYVYDVKLTRGAAVDTVMPASPFVLAPAL